MTAAPKLPLAPVTPGDGIIATTRLVLRPLVPCDVALIEAYASDRTLAEGTRTIPHPLPAGSIDEWLAAAAREPGGQGRDTQVWVIDGTPAGLPAVLGLISLHTVADDQCELEFWIGPAFWNAGYATEAVAGLIAANPCDCRSLVAETFQDNPGPGRVLVHCGFSYLGDAESFSLARGTHVATWTYALSLR